MGHGPGAFSPRDLEPLLRELDVTGTVYVGFSGGADSTALLLALAAIVPDLNRPLVAIHVNHGVHDDAARWAGHCQALCTSLGIELRPAGPPDEPLGPGSPEERLRRYRYDIFEALLEPGDILCTAHHRQDQAETLMLALLRGSGPDGLAAMPASRPLGQGRLVRPLLGVDRRGLEAWLRQQDVAWLTDPSNAEVDADRNYLRHVVFPRLRERWPAADRALATSAGLMADSAALLADESELALTGRLPAAGVLDLRGLEPTAVAFPAILRRWLRHVGAPDLPRARLEELCRQLGDARTDSRVSTCWAGQRLRHYRGALWLDTDSETSALPTHRWCGREPLALGFPAGVLAIVAAGDPGDGTPASVTGASASARTSPSASTSASARARASTRPNARDDAPGRDAPWPDFPEALEVRARLAGDRLRPVASGPSRDLKAWLSASPIPPWRRDSLPVIPGDDGLAAIGDVVLDPALADQLHARKQALCWQPSEPGLRWAWRQCRASLLGVE